MSDQPTTPAPTQPEYDNIQACRVVRNLTHSHLGHMADAIRDWCNAKYVPGRAARDIADKLADNIEYYYPVDQSVLFVHINNKKLLEWFHVRFTQLMRWSAADGASSINAERFAKVAEAAGDRLADLERAPDPSVDLGQHAIDQVFPSSDKDATESPDRDAIAEGISAVLSSNGVDSPLIHWWINASIEDALATAPKAEEYGSIELAEAGHVLASLMRHPIHAGNDAAAMETQIFQYVLGKIGRWVAAMRRGERVSDDTLFDIGIYVKMVRKIRETGVWP